MANKRVRYFNLTNDQGNEKLPRVTFHYVHRRTYECQQVT